MNAPKSEEWKKEMSEKMQGRHSSPNTQFKSGNQHSKETLEKISKSLQGRVAWNKGLTKEQNPSLSRPKSEETKEKMRETALKNQDNIKTLINNGMKTRFQKSS